MSKKMMLLMTACCVIGMGAVAAIFLFRVPLNSVFLGLMLLICPLSHFLMMGMMVKDHNQHQHMPSEASQAKPKSLGEG